MKLHFQILPLGLVAFALIGCAGHRIDPAGEARTKNSVTDAQIAGLHEPIQLEEIKWLLGPSEAQPGPVVTYRSADHAGQFFWVYYSRPDNAPGSDKWFIERIIRADRIEEGGVVVWPHQLAGMSPTDAVQAVNNRTISEGLPSNGDKPSY